ncbi:hypothetical protein DL96DRAFT_464186 [Flagelloscypha sp. PMI_526]|nr:hypothetical protein DL96DRAFT_464186 [Flagelloscypha sp. PMI_526]
MIRVSDPSFRKDQDATQKLLKPEPERLRFSKMTSVLRPPVSRADGVNSNISLLERVTKASGTPGDVPTAVRDLLLTVKDLQSSIEQWARGCTSSREVNELYIQLGMDLNTTISAFQHHQLDISEVRTVPRDLRSVLEPWMTSPEPLATLPFRMPQIRQVLSRLLKTLNAQQTRWNAISDRM